YGGISLLHVPYDYSSTGASTASSKIPTLSLIFWTLALLLFLRGLSLTRRK
ncbi:MAG: hypothetical protein HQK50_04245, partial [Oligoflexia bacterium]|nr:hypothetical protein [Oligoflexia bacterium]